jgi:hypothetical protein
MNSRRPVHVAVIVVGRDDAMRATVFIGALSLARQGWAGKPKNEPMPVL